MFVVVNTRARSSSHRHSKNVGNSLCVFELSGGGAQEFRVVDAADRKHVRAVVSVGWVFDDEHSLSFRDRAVDLERAVMRCRGDFFVDAVSALDFFSGRFEDEIDEHIASGIAQRSDEATTR